MWPRTGDQCSSGATITSEGYNLASDASCNLLAAGDKPSQLAKLAKNGGPTATRALRAGSPALNAGTPGPFGVPPACAPSDQRGAPRSGHCDIAYERVRCHGVLVNRVGTAGGNTLIGTRHSDGLLGLGGNDLLRGGRGADALCGGRGRDRLDGGRGRDRCDGGPGHDRARHCERKQSVP